jgi:Uma2 family endonuclease
MLITAEELLYMPDSGLRRELILGEIRETPPSGFEHGCIAANFACALSTFVRDRCLGSVLIADPGFILATNPDTVRAPDVAFVVRDRVAALRRPRGYFPGSPDLAVEVISPTDTYSEVVETVETWLAAGCCMVVVANPRNRSLKVFRSRADV